MAWTVATSIGKAYCAVGLEQDCQQPLTQVAKLPAHRRHNLILIEGMNACVGHCMKADPLAYPPQTPIPLDVKRPLGCCVDFYILR